MNDFDRELGWDDEITNDSEFTLLPEGDYIFTVQGYERARHTPGANGKLPACNKAIVSVEINTLEGKSVLKTNLFLHSSTEGLLSAFFGSIGLKKKGEPLRMNWNAIAGKTGVCHVGMREYNNNKYNEIKRMIYADDVDYTKVLNANMQTQTQAPVQQPPVQQPQQTTQATQNQFKWNGNQNQGFTPAGTTNVPFN